MADTPLKAHLDALLAGQDTEARVDNDPIRFPRRYQAVADVEVSALLASSYAYGKVDLFIGVLERIHAVLDEHGGPAAFVRAYDPSRHAALFTGMGYRWTRDTDLMWLFAALRHVFETHGDLASAFAGSTARDALASGSEALVDGALATGHLLGKTPATAGDLPRGLRYFVPSPTGGSGCKRGNLFLRWMVRSGDGVDLGVWTHLSPADLVMPIDRHVQRIAPLLGLVERTDGSWRTAAAITRSLATLCPEDPVRYDFALAHTGISDGCTGALVPDICSRCAIRAVCTHGSGLRVAVRPARG